MHQSLAGQGPWDFHHQPRDLETKNTSQTTLSAASQRPPGATDTPCQMTARRCGHGGRLVTILSCLNTNFLIHTTANLGNHPPGPEHNRSPHVSDRQQRPVTLFSFHSPSTSLSSQSTIYTDDTFSMADMPLTTKVCHVPVVHPGPCYHGTCRCGGTVSSFLSGPRASKEAAHPEKSLGPFRARGSTNADASPPARQVARLDPQAPSTVCRVGTWGETSRQAVPMGPTKRTHRDQGQSRASAGPDCTR